jgi:hypothetical protein
MREFRLTRITPEDVKERLNAGEKVLIVDLQGRLGHPRDRQGIPGAVRIDPHKLEQYDERDKRVQIPAPMSSTESPALTDAFSRATRARRAVSGSAQVS